MNEPKIAILILVYNDWDCVQTLIPLIKKNTERTIWFNSHVYIIDNGSKEDLRLKVADSNFYHTIHRVIRFEQNLGFGGAYNRVIDELDEDYFVFINADILPQKNWLSPIINVMEKDQNIGIGSGICIHLNDADKSVNFSKKNTVVEIPQAIGTYFVYRKSLVEKIGCFDPFIFLYYEDTELSFRTIVHGYKIVCLTGSLIFHGRTTEDVKRKFPSKIVGYMIQNGFYVVWKYFGIRYLILKMILTFSAFLKALFKFDFAKVKGIIVGTKKFIEYFPMYKIERETLTEAIPNFRERVNYIKKLKKNRIDNLYKHIDTENYLINKWGETYRKNRGNFLVITFN